MTRLELFAAVKALSHRNDLADFFDTALIMAESKIAKDLRTTELVTFAQIDTALAETNPGAWALPADYLEMRDVVMAQSGRRRALRSAPRDRIAAWSGASGSTAFYSIYNGVIEFRPLPGGALVDIIYYAKQAPLLLDADTNESLDAFPEIYIFATLVGVWTWAQNEKEKIDSLNEFNTAVAAANEFAENQQFGTAMQQHSANNYRQGRRWA